MGEVTPIGPAFVARAADAAMRRLCDGGAENLIGRATRLARECRSRGAVGLLAVDDFPDSGRVMVPSALLQDLLTIAQARMVGK